MPLWVSVGGFSADDYALCCARLDGDDRIAAIELNLSCPNVEEAPETAAELVSAARGATSKTLYAKLSPAQWDIAESARAVVAAGADGLSLVNTIRGSRARSGHASATARVEAWAGTRARPCGRSRSPASMRARRRSTCRSWAWAVSSRARDAVELAAVGASAVALGTVLFADPLAPARIRAEMVPEVAALGSEGLPANRARLLSI